MPSELGQIHYERDEHVARITIDRPNKQNALTTDMISKLVTTIREVDEDDDVRAAIITGAGDDAFCAGGDLAESIPEILDSVSDETFGPDDPLYAMNFRFELIRTPLIAAVNGYCVAGGLELLHATDVRIAEEGALFGHQEPRWGLFPAGGATVRMPRHMPYCKAMEYLLTGDLFPAEHARDAGLVNEVVDDGAPLRRAEEVAYSIAENSPTAVQKIKESVVRGLGTDIEHAFEIEAAIGREVWRSDQATEGAQAFLDGQDPNFTH